MSLHSAAAARVLHRRMCNQPRWFTSRRNMPHQNMPPQNMLRQGMLRHGMHDHRMRGFTLLETLLVITIIAALSLLLLAMIGGGIKGLRLRSSAKEIVSELRLARAQAMAKGEVQRFVIDPKARAWHGAKQHHGEFSKQLEVTFTGARELQPRRDQGAIVFFEDGASSGGRIQLRQDRAAWNVDVAWLTGDISLHRAEVER